MYGKYVEVDGQTVWVWCCPDTPQDELESRARALLAERAQASTRAEGGDNQGRTE